MAAEIAGLAGVPAPQVLSVQGVPGGTPVVVIGGGGTGDVNIVEYGGVATSLGQKPMASSIPVTLASDQSPLPVTVSAGTDRTATGTITAAQNVEINTQASGACGVQVTGVWTGTLVFESTIDGVTWNPALAVNSVTGDEITQTTANGNWVIACAGFQKVRARGNTVTSGSATVFLDASTCPQVVTIGGPIPKGSATIGGVEVRDGANQLDVNVSGQAAIQDPPNLDVALSTRLNTLGQKAMAASAPVVIASDQSTLPVSVAALPLPTGAATAANQTNGTQLTGITDGTDIALVTAAGALVVDGSAVTQPISAAALPLPTGAATAALQTQPGVDIGDVTVNNGAGAAAVNIQDGGNSITVDGPLTDAQLRAAAVPISAAALPLPAGAATEATLATRAAATQLPAALVGGRLDANIGAWLGSTAPTVGQKTMAASIPVTLASDQPAIPVSSTPSASTASAVTQVAGSLVVVTLQALNAARKGLTLYNEGNQAWYVKLGAAATLTSFTVKILRDGYYEVPFGYTGIVTGIQAVSSSSLYVTELT